ncbi:hypothetical protein [Luteibacter sp. E-22]|uniref:hypothetical protein n=1 Tax=Luteibacter sp. E-22 TaxID=3404050 RepID=UPI003CF0CF28
MTSKTNINVLAVMSAVAEFGVSAPEWHDMGAARDVVAETIKKLDLIGALSMARRVGGPDPMDLHELDRALGMAIDMSHEALATLGASA